MGPTKMLDAVEDVYWTITLIFNHNKTASIRYVARCSYLVVLPKLFKGD